MKETHVCTACGEEKPVGKFHQENGAIRRNTCMACLGKRDRAKLKLDMLNAFGGKCQCCGEDHPYFLTLDHIQNYGHRVQREVDFKTTQQIYRQARKEGWPKDKYQLLCMNCNSAKGFYGECPHKTGISSQQALQGIIDWDFKVNRSYVSPETKESQNKGLAFGPQARKHNQGFDLEAFLKFVEAQQAKP